MRYPRTVSDEDVQAYVEANIGEFHAKRVGRLQTLALNSLLRRKNPYLFRTKHIQTAHDLVKPMLDAHIVSQEETMFGGFLEGLAVRVAEIAFEGRTSGIEGIDLELDKGNTRYIVSIKSGRTGETHLKCGVCAMILSARHASCGSSTRPLTCEL